MDKHDYTVSNMQPISGILSAWAVVTFSFEGELMVNGVDKGATTLLFGNVDIDYKARFSPGNYIKTSLVQHFDKTDFTVTTRNSCYQLNGNGYEMVADIQFFNLFMDRGFTPRQIIRGFPHLIGECVTIEASSTHLH